MHAIVVAVFGPTGVGKTAVAVALAERLRRLDGDDPVAVSADALQRYRGLSVLTGAASAAEQARLEHRLLATLELTERSSAGAFAAAAHAEIDALLTAGRTPIVVGGTGLYLRAALSELELRPPPAPGVREALLERAAREGAAALHAELDPESAARIAPGDTHRIVRALEAGPLRASDQLWTASTRHPTLLAGLTMEREALYERIETRVDAMLAAGAAEEVARADAAGASETARAAIGFDALLRGDVETMKRDTRRYARRQLTWMRKLAGATVLDITARAPEDVAAQLHDLIRAARA